MTESAEIARLALRIATGSEEVSARAIADLMLIELGLDVVDVTAPGAVSFAVAISAANVTVKLGDWPELSISREDAVTRISNSRPLLSFVLENVLGDEPADLGYSSDIEGQRRAAESGVPRITFVSDEPSVPVVGERLRQAVDTYGVAALVGASSSGKTVTIDSLSRLYAADSSSTLWINLSDPAISPEGFLAALLRIRNPEYTRRSLIVLDDLQSAPSVGRVLLKIWTTIKPNADLVIGCWPDALDVLANYVGPEQRVYCDGVLTCRRLVSDVRGGTNVRERLLALAQGDALIAELGADYFESTGAVPSPDQLAGRAFEVATGGQILDEAENAGLFDLACLGMFEIDAHFDLLSQDGRAAVRSLAEKKVVRLNGDYVHVGHRTLARLIARHYQVIADTYRQRLIVPFVVRYLRRAGEAQIRQTLDRLDLVSVADDGDQFGAAFLAQCWSSVRVLVAHLSRQIAVDPTWGDNVASAVFAGEAFSELGMLGEWSVTARYVRSRWLVPDGDVLPLPTSPDTAEADDFREIQRKMVEEDELLGTVSEPGISVDVVRFHRNWVLGLLLGFEAKAMQVDVARRAGLIRMAIGAQQANGSFYPARVPWVTARVLIGLAYCGESVSSSVAVRSAADWLRARPPTGPCSFGVWRPGTGTWNTDIQMTAMALLALGRVGLGATDRSVRTGLEFLKAGRGEWYRPGKEIDCAQAVEAALVLGATWRDFAPEIANLLAWAQDSRSWDDARTLASVKQDESSKVPAVASALIAIIWETVRTELPLLLQSVMSDHLDSPGLPPNFVSWQEVVLLAIERLDEAVARNISDRESVVSRGSASRVVVQAMLEWKRRRDKLAEYRRSVQDVSKFWHAEDMSSIQAGVNSLGDEVFGSAWEEV